jgi:glycosyltransferase involved in cell wall biosynthesis
MRILFISAFYPPFVIGGWEQLVQDVNVGLINRGHSTHVLTSNYLNGSKEKNEPGVSRILSLESGIYRYSPMHFFLGRGFDHRENNKHTKEIIESFRPEVVFIHVMWNMWRGIPWLAEKLLPDRVVYYIADDWPYAVDVVSRYWNDPARKPIMRQLKSVIGLIPLQVMKYEKRRYPLQFRYVLCVSQAIREKLYRFAGISLERSQVVYNGINPTHFQKLELRDKQHKGLKLLYAGSLVSHKGVDTAIEAMSVLARRSANNVTLTIVGSGHPAYEARLKELVSQEGLGERVHFRSRIAREEMPKLFKEFDVLVFPSIWEGLPRIVQEAMASGLVVVGTNTGGTGEILIQGETGLTFNPGDYLTLANHIELLRNQPELMEIFKQKGYVKVLRQFNIHRMIDEIDQYLFQVVIEASQRTSFLSG